MYLDVSSTYLLILVILFDISYRWIEFEFLRLPEFDLIQFIDQRSLSRMTRIQSLTRDMISASGDSEVPIPYQGLLLYHDLG